MDKLETQPLPATVAPDTLPYEPSMEIPEDDHHEPTEEETNTDDEVVDGIGEDECEFPEHDKSFMDVSPTAMLEVERKAWSSHKTPRARRSLNLTRRLMVRLPSHLQSWKKPPRKPPFALTVMKATTKGLSRTVENKSSFVDLF